MGVAKPTVSAGSKDTARWTTAAEVHAHSADLLAAGRHSMTQPYIASVDDEGETAMLFFGGRTRSVTCRCTCASTW